MRNECDPEQIILHIHTHRTKESVREAYAYRCSYGRLTGSYRHSSSIFWWSFYIYLFFFIYTNICVCCEWISCRFIHKTSVICMICSYWVSTCYCYGKLLYMVASSVFSLILLFEVWVSFSQHLFIFLYVFSHFFLSVRSIWFSVDLMTIPEISTHSLYL